MYIEYASLTFTYLIFVIAGSEEWRGGGGMGSLHRALQYIFPTCFLLPYIKY